MIGHQQILNARLAGQCPGLIFVEIGTPRGNPERAIAEGERPVVYVRADELAGPMDLRFLVGCNVVLQATRWTKPFIEFGDRVAKSGAKTVVMDCIAECDDVRVYNDGDWIDHVR